MKELRQRLWSELPQNSPNSRHRLTSVILGRFFPDKKIEQLPLRVCMAYQDDALLASVMGPLLLLAEPVLGVLFARKHDGPAQAKAFVSISSKKQKKFTMKITLELPPDVEARLRESAARYDADTVRRLLVEAFTPTVEALLRELPDALTDTAFEAVADQLADELSACHRPNAPVLSDHAVSRAGIYEDHP